MENDSQPTRLQNLLHNVMTHRRRIIIGLLLVVVLLWTLLPALRAVAFVANTQHRQAYVPVSNGHSVQSIRFRATDGVQIAGSLITVSDNSPTVILVHGFKGNSGEMQPWATMLTDAGYNVLMYDSRGCGASDDWKITLGVNEPDDVIGAVHFLQRHSHLVQKFAVLGVSLGAGIAILAAAREPAISAVIADSAWVDLHGQTDRMGSLQIGRFSLPLLPYEATVVGQIAGKPLSTVSPLAAIPSIAPRATLLIHSADDANSLTPLTGAKQLDAAAGSPHSLWIVPNGGHVGAIVAYPTEYRQHVIDFLQHYVG